MVSLTLTHQHLQSMINHVDQCAPLEACGLLAGQGSTVEKVIPVQNQAQSPVRYVMDPIEQLNAFEWIESNGLELLGIFHSHPAGPEMVSPTDVAEAAYAVVYVILSRAGNSWRPCGFWIEEGSFQDVRLQII
jgi:proteasome lid subunit RPN8/RPN11